MSRLAVIAAAIALAGCPTPTAREPARTAPRIELPPPEITETRAVDGIRLGETREGQLPAEPAIAVGFVAALSEDARVRVRVEGPPGSVAAVLGPATAEGFGDAPKLVLGATGVAHRLSIPAGGGYLIGAVGRGRGGPVTVTVECTGTECRPPCALDNRCPPSTSCALAMCAGEPCVSYCQGTPPVVEPPPQLCGTRGADECPDGEFCAFGADCGATDRGGECRARPRICTREWRPVCGCDGRTYGNACSAAAAGASVQRGGACEPP